MVPPLRFRSYLKRASDSASHTEHVACVYLLWDVEELLNNRQNEPNIQQFEDDSDDSDDMDMDLIPCPPAKGSTKKIHGNGRSSNYSTANFFADL